MDLSTVAALSVAAALVVLILIAALLRARSWDHEERQVEHPYVLPENRLYVAPTYHLAAEYLRRQGLTPSHERIATQGFQVRGFSGTIVMIDGERNAFRWPEGLEDDVWACVGVGRAQVERVYV